MTRLIAVAGFAFAVATSAQAMTPASIPQPDSMITQVAYGCGPFEDSHWWRLCGQSHRSSDAPRGSPLCSMDRYRLRCMAVLLTAAYGPGTSSRDHWIAPLPSKISERFSGLRSTDDRLRAPLARSDCVAALSMYAAHFGGALTLFIGFPLPKYIQMPPAYSRTK